MKDGPNIVRIAALIGDHTRTEVLTALLGGKALTATELAAVAAVTKQTISSHLAMLTDAQLIAKAFRNEKCCRLALAFEQGVRRDSRSHLYGFDLPDRDGHAFRQREEMTNPRDCRILILLGVLREELVCQQCAIRLFGDDIGKRATAVDPELPATGTIVGGVFYGHEEWNSAVRLAIIAIQPRGES